MTKKGSKRIIATLDEARIISGYNDFTNVDVCSLIHKYNQTMVSPYNADAWAVCSSKNNKFNIIVKGGRSTDINPYMIWSDLTAKLRLQ